MHIANTLVAVELLLAPNLVEDLNYLSLDLRFVAGSLEGFNIASRHRAFKDLAGKNREVLRVNAENSDEAGLAGITVNVCGSEDVGVSEVDVLNALRRNVLAVGKLEDVLLTVDDLQRTGFVDLTDIAGVEPTIGLNCLLVLLVVLVVALEHGRTTKKNLAARVGLIVDRVVVVGNGFEADLDTGTRGTKATGAEVTFNLDSTSSVRLGHTVALTELVAEGGAEEFLHVGVELGAAANHGAGVVEADSSADLASPKLIVEKVGVVGLAHRELHGSLLASNHVPGESTLETRSLDGCGFDGRVEAVEQPRDGNEGRGLEDLEILNKANDVAAEEADRGARKAG